MHRVNHRYLDFACLLRASLVHRARSGDTFGLQPCAQLVNPYNLRLKFLSQLNRVGDVIEMPVRDQHRIDAVKLFILFRAHWIRQNPRIDKNYFSGGRLDSKGSVAQPRQLVSSRLNHEFSRLNWYENLRSKSTATVHRQSLQRSAALPMLRETPARIAAAAGCLKRNQLHFRPFHKRWSAAWFLSTADSRRRRIYPNQYPASADSSGKAAASVR